MKKYPIQLFDIDMENISGNSIYGGIHWLKRKKIAHDWHLVVINQIKIFNIKPIRCKVEIEFLWNNRFDLDNNFFMRKMIIDGIVKAGILKSDTKKHIVRLVDRIGEFVNIRVVINEIP